jgi:hypothetical protein
VADLDNPENPIPGKPSTPLQIQLWEHAQLQSQAYSEQTDFMYDLNQPVDGVYQPGQGSQARGTYVTNGTLPNEGNTP